MKSPLSTVASCLVAMVLSLPAFAQDKPDDQSFIILQHDWAEARKNADMHFLERFYAKEFSVGTLDGGEASRSEDLIKFSSGDLKPSVIDDSEMRVSIYGETAMVTGERTLRRQLQRAHGSIRP